MTTCVLYVQEFMSTCVCVSAWNADGQHEISGRKSGERALILNNPFLYQTPVRKEAENKRLKNEKEKVRGVRECFAVWVKGEGGPWLCGMPRESCDCLHLRRNRREARVCEQRRRNGLYTPTYALARRHVSSLSTPHIHRKQKHKDGSEIRSRCISRQSAQQTQRCAGQIR